MSRIYILLAALALVSLLSSSVAAVPPYNFGVQGGYGGDADWFIGARAEAHTAPIFKNSRFVVAYNYFFPGGNANFMEIDANYLFPLKNIDEDSKSNLYVGAGLNSARTSVDNVDGSSWDFGMNGLVGFGYGMGSRIMFAEFGYAFFSDADQWKIGTGFLF